MDEGRRALAKSFVHLHLHTEFSMLDGAARIAEVVATAAADGQPAVGITDHGNMYGVLDFYRAARDADLTPVIGTEAYMVTTVAPRPAAARRARHLPPHAARGVHAGLQATSSRCRRSAYLDGFFQKPRVDFDLLEQHHEGLVGTTGCLGGAVSQALLKGDYTLAQRARRALPVDLRARLVLRRAAGPRPPRAAPGQPAADQAGARHARAAARHQRLATTRTAHDAESHDALLCVQTGALQSTTRSASSSTPTSST